MRSAEVFEIGDRVEVVSNSLKMFGIKKGMKGTVMRLKEWQQNSVGVRFDERFKYCFTGFDLDGGCERGYGLFVKPGTIRVDEVRVLEDELLSVIGV